MLWACSSRADDGRLHGHLRPLCEVPVDGVPYPVFVFAGVIPWQYFRPPFDSASGASSRTSTRDEGLLPAGPAPAGAVVTPLVDFVLGFLVLLGDDVLVRHRPDRAALLRPLFVAPRRGHRARCRAVFYRALSVRYRDVPYAIPFFLQICRSSPASSSTLDQLPDELAMDSALNPMTAAIAGWRWALLDAPRSELGQTALSVAVAILLLAGGLAVLPLAPSRASRTRSDGRSRSRPTGSRSATASAQSRPATGRCATRSCARRRRVGRPRARARRARGDLGARRRLVRGWRGRGARRDRAQRRRQVHAAQDPDADHVAHRRAGARSAAGSAACSRSGPASTRSSPAARTSILNGVDPRHEAPRDHAASSTRSSTSPASSGSSTRP